MRCAWTEYINLLPAWMRNNVDIQGKDHLLELRLRLGLPPEMVMIHGSKWLDRIVAKEDLNFCINAASRYSPWTSETISSGYITAQGGHRIGLCGIASAAGQAVSGMRDVTSICLRVARDFPGISKELGKLHGSILIIGNPGSGKTTLLRDILRYRSEHFAGSTCVVDEKGEIFPGTGNGFFFPIGRKTDVLTGFRKAIGIDMTLRNMSPVTIAVDEITAKADCDALIHAGWCGVQLIATAHAGNKEDLYSRPVYRPIIDSGLFDSLVILREDKSWRLERMNG